MVWGGGPGEGAAGAHGPLVSLAVVAEFGRIAVEFLRRGSNPKVYDGAARKQGRGAVRPGAWGGCLLAIPCSPGENAVTETLRVPFPFEAQVSQPSE